MAHIIERLLAGWLLLNIAIPAFLIYQRSPSIRHMLFRWTIGGTASLHDRALAHALVDAAHAHH
jgi:hypothetical protein